MRRNLRRGRVGPSAREATGHGGSAGRHAAPIAAQISDDLRRHGGALLEDRRRTAGLSLLASAAMAAVATYQFGLLRHLPEPPGRFFDADRVDAAPEAYALLRTPDAALGLVSYGITLALAGAGSADRHHTAPLVPIALAGKVLIDVASSAYLTIEQASRHRRFCSWCLLAAVASAASVPHVVPEAALALRHVVRRRPPTHRTSATRRSASPS